ncbi:hypothetical protein ABK040_005403 [Willaertia magna]
MSSDTAPSIGTASSDDQPLTLRNARAYHQANEITLAMNIAKSRERFRWAAGYSTILTAGTFVTWAFTKKFPALMLLPLSASIYYTFWEYDLGYGKKLHRMGSEAQNIQTKERYKYFGKY